MIVRCPDCLTKYEIASSRVPESGIKVRCPKCKAVFPVHKSEEEAAVTSPAENGNGSVAAKPEPTQSAPTPKPTPAPVAASSASAPISNRPASRLVTDPTVARRMARAVIHEIILARKTEHEVALGNKSLLQSFGKEIASAFDLYEERISPDLPQSKTIFRSALNEILGRGKVLI
ncbi:MAG: hypothetical protein HKN21_14715 [Candidatus Eisenbacteria bacterium]|uniref:Zinc finger/thioredoxin putative domain-containing protein n=1 Tax=Eiseniibacteriota bacterium TaxID=2212470 RepID=A0A7Y2EA27_UNCEI|nr:hypothetical protein [Candidatus Eisenbacteria bacterium]